jgi:hypothetical protein
VCFVFFILFGIEAIFFLRSPVIKTYLHWIPISHSSGGFLQLLELTVQLTSFYFLFWSTHNKLFTDH